MRVLLIKLSSMGDVIHTLPAITDAMHNVPGIEFDWVVEPSFSEIAAWHPAVRKVFKLPLRSKKYNEVWQVIKDIKRTKYDLVIDAQGLIKSSIVAAFLRSHARVGFDWGSCREGLACTLYHKRFNIPWMQHAVIRLRKLFAQIFSYTYEQDYVDYGIAWQDFASKDEANNPYVMFLHGTTWETKHWPDEYWVGLANLLAKQGITVKVTWATLEQKERAMMLRNKCSNVEMLPHLTLNQALVVLQNAVGVVAVDTGFAHLSAALNKPLVAIYGPTDVIESGTVSNRNINLSSKFSCAPCVKRICHYKGSRDTNPPCFAEISPEIVLDNLQRLMAKA